MNGLEKGDYIMHKVNLIKNMLNKKIKVAGKEEKEIANTQL